MRRVLFVSEAVTLAQVVRLATLARALDPARFEVHFAAAHFDEMIFAGTAFTRHQIHSLAPNRRRAGRFRPSHLRPADSGPLRRRRTDAAPRAPAEPRRRGPAALAVRLGPPGRHSLRLPHQRLLEPARAPRGLSAPRSSDREPPRGAPGRALFPEGAAGGLPALRATGERAPRAARPPVARQPVRRAHARRSHALPRRPRADPHAESSGASEYLGPVLWSPPVPLPPWWDALDPQRPTIYVTLGSSGRVERLPLVVDVAAGLGYQVLVATAGRSRAGRRPPACPRRRLPAGRSRGPPRGAGRLERRQHHRLPGARRGATGPGDRRQPRSAPGDDGHPGCGRRASAAVGNADARALADALQRLVSEPSYTQAAGRLRDEFARWNAPATFAAFVEEATA